MEENKENVISELLVLDSDREMSAQNDKRTCTVNLYMIPAKLAYLLEEAHAAINQYLFLFYISIGLDVVNAGVINGAKILCGIITAPLWCLFADKTQRHKTTATITCVVGILVICLQPLFAEMYGDPHKTLCPHRSNKTFNESHFKKFSDPVVISNGNLNPQHKASFHSILVISIIAAIFQGSIVSFLDSGTLRRVHASPSPCEYGSQRVFAATGWVIGSLLYSFAIAYFPKSNISCYSGIFIVYFILSSCLALNMYWLFNGITLSPGNLSDKKDITKIFISSMKNFETIFLLMAALMNGFFAGLWFGFSFIYLEELNAPTLLLGFSTVVISASSGVAYIYSNKIINILHGPMGALSFSCFVWSLRFLSFAYIENPYLVLSINVIHGLTSSLGKVAVIEYIKRTTDPLIQTTMCAIKNAVDGFGCAVVYMIGGKLYSQYGGRQFFIGSSLICFVYGFVIILHISKKYLMKPQRT